jgi:hypothetical protein
MNSILLLALAKTLAVIIAGVVVAVLWAVATAAVYKLLGAEARRVFLQASLVEFQRGHTYNDRRSL